MEQTDNQIRNSVINLASSDPILIVSHVPRWFLSGINKIYRMLYQNVILNIGELGFFKEWERSLKNFDIF